MVRIKLSMVILFWSFFMGISAHALEGKTFIFFINGDWHYQGPVFEEEGIRIKDQANLIYRQMVAVAKKDRKNNYILFYDPKGEGRLFNRQWVKLRIYEKGKRIFGLGLTKPEVSTGSIAFYNEFSQIISQALGDYKKEDTLFYYYGEHFPAKGESPLDLGAKEPGAGTIGLKKILKLMEAIGPFETSVFHTCYINALDYVQEFLRYSQNVLLPQYAILNTPMNWSNILKAHNFNEAIEFLKRDNNHNPKYQWISYGHEVSQLSGVVLALESQLSQDHWQHWWSQQLLSNYEGLRQRGDDVLFMSYIHGLQNLDGSPIQQEQVHIPFYDYINLINQYLFQDLGLLEKVDDLLDENPHLEMLYKVL